MYDEEVHDALSAGDLVDAGHGGLAGAALASGFISTGSIFYLGVSARVLGMGGAFIALADDEAAAFYNPAGLVQLGKIRLASNLSRPFWEYSYADFGGAGKGWGAYAMLPDSDAIQGYDIHGNPTSSFRYTSAGTVGGLGFRVGANFSLGIQFRGYGLIFPTQAAGFSLSPSFLWRQGNFSFGAVWVNLLNVPISFVDGHSEPWTPDIAAGVAWNMGKETLLIDFTEQLITRGDISCVRIGGESSRLYPLVFRAGANRDWASIGFSYYWNGLRLDFAYLIYYALPNSYIISASYEWGP